MTRGYIQGVYRDRGYAVAMQTARVSGQRNMVEEVERLHSKKTGIPSGVQVFKKSGRKEIPVGVIPAKRKVPTIGDILPVKKSNKRSGGELTSVEMNARLNALKVAQAEGRA